MQTFWISDQGGGQFTVDEIIVKEKEVDSGGDFEEHRSEDEQFQYRAA